MEKEKTFKTPKKILARVQVVHFGKILFNLEFIVLAIMLASVLSFIIPALYYIILVCIAFFSLFTLLLNPTFLAMWNGGESLARIAEVMAQSWKYTVPILLALCVASIVCLCLDKNKKHIARIVFSAIFAVAAIVVLVLKLINGGGAQ